MSVHGGLRTYAFYIFTSPLNFRHYSVIANLPRDRQGKILETLIPNLTTSETQLLQCLVDRDFTRAREQLEEMPHKGCQRGVVAWTSVLSKLSKRGEIYAARALFEIMPERNIVTYNAMLSGYIRNGRLDDACRFFNEMPERNVVSWTSMLCGLMSGGMVEDAKRLFELMPETNLVTWNSMIVGLMRNGDVDGARRVFDMMPLRNLVSFNAMIDGFAENYRMEDGRALFDRMEDKNLITWTSLVAGYCKVGDVRSAYDMFKRMPERNVVSWTAMIGGFTWNGYYEKAILMFLEMKRSSDAKPNNETKVSLAYACAGYGSRSLGMQLHAHIIVNYQEFHDDDGRLLNGLIYMYSKLGRMDYADFLFFENSRNRTIQSCNAMINGYVQIGLLEKALYIFNTMPLHDNISWTSIISGHFSAGQVWKACELFSKCPDRDASIWTVLISGHVQNELFEEANLLFSNMRAQGFAPLEFTYSTLLRAAGAMADLGQGRRLHCLLIKSQSALDLILQNALISMYAKCGQLDDAYHIFSRMAHRDLISWNSMIIGFSLRHGLEYHALELFEAMKRSEMKPNSVTFLGILSACNNSGLVEEAREAYRTMIGIYGIQPDVQHHVCMINLLGRAGRVKEAENFVLNLPTEPGIAVWGALLGVCSLREGNTEIASHAARRLMELDPLNAPGYIVLCKVHALNGEHAAGGILRMEMRLKGITKVPGCSWI